MSNEISISSSLSSFSPVSAEATEFDCQGGGNFSSVQNDSQSSSSSGNEMNKGDEFGVSENLFKLTPEEEQWAVARKIFGFHWILRKILSHISSQNLFKLRLVNKLWEEEATSAILEDSSTQLRVKYEWNKSCLVSNAKRSGNTSDRTLGELNNCISSSRRFPCSHFEMDDSLKYYHKTADLTQFLRLHGEEIKTYKIWNDSIFLHEKILAETAPNIQKLTITGGWETENEDDEHVEYYGESLLFPKKVTLPNLKILKVDQYSSKVDEIIRAAPNLQKIDGQLMKAVDTLISVKKLNLVKTLYICPEFAGFPQFLKKWADQNPKLRRLHLWSECCNVDSWTLNMEKPLSTLLEASRESLKEISVSLDDMFFNPEVIWPKFENVEVLSVCRMMIDVQPFPRNFISNVFPNIKKLKVQTWGPQDPEFVDISQLSFLVTESPLLRLNIVEIEDGNPEWFNVLGQTAPNVEELILTGYTSLFKSMSFISRLSKLRKLSFGSKHGVLSLLDEFPQLEMAMTGLSEDMVRKLNEDPLYFEEMKGQKIPRVTPSILDCQALEKLTIRTPVFGVEGDDKALQTLIIQEFGFKLMSQVNWTN